MSRERKMKEWKADANGVLRERVLADPAKADVALDLKLRFAHQRRGLAMGQAGRMTYDCHELWVDKMFRELMRVPPPGYAR
eukprot:11189163-Lingulodinium_polyedra.AAC.1